MKKLLFLLFTIHCSLFTASAQNQKIDSLLNELKKFDAKKLEHNKNQLPEEEDTKIGRAHV